MMCFSFPNKPRLQLHMYISVVVTVELSAHVGRLYNPAEVSSFGTQL